MTAIVWFRRDLRLGDNTALTAALERHDVVVPVFIRDAPLLHGANSGLRRNLRLDRALVALDIGLREKGSRLIVREGRPGDALAALAQEIGAEEVFAHRDYTPHGLARESEVATTVLLNLEPGVLATEPEEMGQWRVFAAFHRRWTAAAIRPALDTPLRMPHPPDLASLPLPDVAPRGEVEALRRAHEFARKVMAYSTDRDRLDREATSHLSADLHFGTISVRQVLAAVGDAARTDDGAGPGARAAGGADDAGAAAGAAAAGAAAFRRQLAWRDWANHLLWWNPASRTAAWREAFRTVRWREDPEDLEAWRNGSTGFPAVDAGMRQLRAEGWISNRTRLIVASFLTKDLLIDWREGERHFLRHLEDADVANNWLGWQWVAGVGTDAAPYFRILNPTSQGERFDPDGSWVRRWVPELRDVAGRLVHRPWEAGERPRDYPPPMVDHAFARERARAAFRDALGR